MAHDHSHQHEDHHDHADHGYEHGHNHGHHHHAHAPASFGGAFAVATALNLGLVAVQVVYGLAAHSVALLADAGHNFGDAIGLLLAWGAYALARVKASERFTYGFRSASILSALCNAVLLLIATGAIAWAAIQRFAEPAEVASTTVMVVAAAGIVINGVSAWLLMRGQKSDLNIRGAFMHLLADAVISAGVVVAGAAIALTGWSWIDPAASLAISAVIVWGTWGLLRESVQMSMDAVPSGIAPGDIRGYLEKLPGVASVHDLHIWAMSTSENALTAHLVMQNGHPGDAFLIDLCRELDHKFHIHHPTIQIEMGDAGICELEPAARV
ncbi:MAG TPA: cation diffusion facilitator family transporter [Dongiaceae bacterium]